MWSAPSPAAPPATTPSRRSLTPQGKTYPYFFTLFRKGLSAAAISRPPKHPPQISLFFTQKKTTLSQQLVSPCDGVLFSLVSTRLQNGSERDAALLILLC